MPSPPDPLITPFFLVVSLFQVLAAVSAVLLARRRIEHRPIAIFLSVEVMANALHEALRVLVLVPARAVGGGAPFTGWTRVAGHAATALGLSWPAGLALVGLVVLMRVRPLRAVLSVVASWASITLLLALAYPVARGEVLAWALAGCEIASVLVIVSSLIQWAYARKPEPPQVEHAAIVLLLMAEVSSLLVGPWLGGDLYTRWPLAQMAYAVTYMVLVAIQGGALTWLSSSK